MVAGVAGEIDKDVDAILLDQGGGLLVALRGDVAPTGQRVTGSVR